MSEQQTRADSIRFYLTGATSDGGTQIDPLAALGGYASSTEVNSLVPTIASPITGLSVIFAAGANGIGNGTITAVDANTVAWTAPGGTQGPAVSISSGQTKLLEDGTDSSKYIRVSRSSATAMSGAATVSLAYALNNSLIGTDVTTAEQSTGRVEYFALMLKNVSASQVNNLYIMLSALGTQRVSGSAQLGASGAGSIAVSTGDFSDWPDTGFVRIVDSGGNLREIAYYSSRTSSTLTVPSYGRGLLGTTAAAGLSTDLIYPVSGLRIASETPSPNPGPIQTIANKTTSPTGRTWKTGVTTANGISAGNIASGAELGLWIEETVVPGQSSSVRDLSAIVITMDAS